MTDTTSTEQTEQTETKPPRTRRRASRYAAYNLTRESFMGAVCDTRAEVDDIIAQSSDGSDFEVREV